MTSPFTIGMLIFDNMTNLDFAGPADMFARVPDAKTVVLATSGAAVTTDSGGRVLPDMPMSEAPKLDLIFVGGGPGTLELMEDDAVLAFLTDRAPHAQWITSVCTGALVLGAAGLLRGYRATTHWTAMDALPLFGAIPVRERVVIDRNRATGGGVTAGIDFALTLIAEIWDPQRAQIIQLGSEYDPAPPFNAGSPDTAPPELVARFRERSQPLTDRRFAAAQRAAQKKPA